MPVTVSDEPHGESNLYTAYTKSLIEFMKSIGNPNQPVVP